MSVYVCKNVCLCLCVHLKEIETLKGEGRKGEVRGGEAGGKEARVGRG